MEIEFLTKREATALLRISIRSLDRMIQRYQLPVYKITGKALIKRSDLMKLIQRSKVS